MPRPGVEERRRAGDVVEAREQVIQLDRLADVGTEGDRDSHPEVLRRLEHLAACRVLQQIPVIEGPHPEVFELLGPGRIDRVVELARVGLDEPQYPLIDQADVEPEADGLRERVNAQALHFLIDETGEQPGSEPGVFRFLEDERGRGPDRQLVQFACRGAVIEAGNRLQRYAHGIDVRQAIAEPCDRADDLVDVDRLMRAVALGDAHLGAPGGRRGQTEGRLLWGQRRRRGRRTSSGFENHRELPSSPD